MLDQKTNWPERATEVLGDLNTFAEQLGGADGLGQLPLSAAARQARRLETLPALRSFLDRYSAEVLIPHELPAIARAYRHATRYEIRELIAFDQELSRSPSLETAAQVSRSVGQQQLKRLRPLRGERLVQRYLAAVESGQANGWHTVVYGLVLALYSLPLRQGLVHFAQQTLHGFLRAAHGSIGLGFSSEDGQPLIAALAGPISKSVEEIVAEACISASPSD